MLIEKGYSCRWYLLGTQGKYLSPMRLWIRDNDEHTIMQLESHLNKSKQQGCPRVPNTGWTRWHFFLMIKLLLSMYIRCSFLTRQPWAISSESLERGTPSWSTLNNGNLKTWALWEANLCCLGFDLSQHPWPIFWSINVGASAVRCGYLEMSQKWPIYQRFVTSKFHEACIPMTRLGRNDRSHSEGLYRHASLDLNVMKEGEVVLSLEFLYLTGWYRRSLAVCLEAFNTKYCWHCIHAKPTLRAPERLGHCRGKTFNRHVAGPISHCHCIL